MQLPCKHVPTRLPHISKAPKQKKPQSRASCVAKTNMPPKAAIKDVDMSDLEDDLLNSEVENDEQPAQPVINRTVIKKTATKPRAATAKASAKKPATATATTKAATAAAKVTKMTKAQREALKDRTNTTHESDDDVEEAAPAKPKDKKARPAKAKEDEAEAGAPEAESEPAPAPKKTARVAKPKAAAPVEEKEIPDSQVPKARKPRSIKRANSPERIESIPETQAAPGDVSHTIENDDEMDIDREPSLPPPPPVVKAASRARSTSRQRHAQPVYPQRARSNSIQPRSFSRSRAGSVSDTERRMAESEAKKKLHDMTRKYEDMRIKYDSLQELAQNAAESNFDKLKKASDEKTKDANNLIASLKREISELRKTSSTSTSEAARLRSEVASLQTSAEKAKEEAKASSSALLEAQNEVKALTAKLDAARKTSQAPTDKTPGSAIKQNLGRSQMIGGSTEATKNAALKEELYRDLTGLIINSVKRKDGEDEYSCIQTGRNGSE